MGSRGASAANLLYISRKSAVEERDGSGCSFVTRHLPDEVLRAESYQELRENLYAFARVREAEERGRTHYRCQLSFEREVETRRVLAMAEEWLSAAFPKARAVVFAHHDTGHRHAHIWIDARQVDGKKIDLSPRQFRTLDEQWNRIYCREMERPEREHLDKKAETHAYKRARARGEACKPPERGGRRVYEPDQASLR